MTVDGPERFPALGVLRRTAVDRWRIVRLLPRAGWAAVTAAVVNNVLLAAAPVLFIVMTSLLVGRLPAAVREGVDSPAFGRLVTAFVVAAAALSAQQLLAQLQLTTGLLVQRRVDGWVADELMAAALSSPGMEPLDDRALTDRLSEASREVEQGIQSPGAACAGMLALLARYGQLTGYAVVVGVVFSWLAGVGLLAAVLAFRHGQRGGLRKYAAIYGTIVARVRRLTYFRSVATGRPAAKEIRVFGLLPWLREQYAAAYLDWMRPVWAERRRVYLRPYFGYTALGLVVLVAVLAALGVAGGQREVDLTRLALVIQAILAAIQLGEFYPEADVQTQFGMNAYRAVDEFRAGMRARSALAPASAPAPALVPAPAPASAPALPPAPRPAGEPGAPPPAAVSGLETLTPRSPTAIRFEAVSYRYPHRSAPVFTDLDLTLPPGRCTAIVGLNGAGKTTLVKLLARLATPTSGRITAGGQPVDALPVARWRGNLAVIFQDYLRYEASAADNIALGAAGHAGDLAGIRAAAEAAGILDTLDALPQGLDTPLSGQLRGGVDLSGGQWQRLAIARALFAVRHGASVLVLDEPTASLDVRAEARFFDEIIAATAGVTTVLISHRFATVRRADHIVVLAEGRVAEQGSHDELLRHGGRYARLFELQAARFLDDRPAGDDPDRPDGDGGPVEIGQERSPG
ncbi:ATP-binding cassette domain-containing protein [Micromonospora carbonacea]|uniref:ATP-binding cassette domain-containing protein n=1 Tax=Micromonospora carbonacea TaxID=47853 RepID=A0A7H8XVE6_9ACTN|nr:ATP-binding cassette domain-containing protein [Micromonospora carbonacea]MBB5830151.1 ATP-binding cassette subfamily B protein [Micromonospora carbonacea]QLD27932.1 ATP-binding cassette domain-containing protein [Micromonospora carbonacea]